jgi:hypothetical protein
MEFYRFVYSMGIMYIGKGSNYFPEDGLHSYRLWGDLAACETTWVDVYDVSASNYAKLVWCAFVCRLCVVHLFSTIVGAYSSMFHESVSKLSHILFSASDLVFCTMKCKQRV